MSRALAILVMDRDEEEVTDRISVTYLSATSVALDGILLGETLE